MKRPYIFYFPAYTRSNGIRVMLLLADRLKDDGYEVLYHVQNRQGWNARKRPILTSIPETLRRQAVVVYPEIIAGNPLRVQNVARLVLFFPGRNGGTRSYHRSEMVFSFLPKYLPGADILTIPWIDDALFNDPGLERDRDCVFVYKRGRWRDVPEVKGLVEITMDWPKTREELAELLKRTRTLYSFDSASAVLDEAQLCGAKVFVITEDGIEEYAENYRRITADYDRQYAHFVERTQSSDYRGRIQSRYLFLYWTYAVWRYWIRPLFRGRPKPPPLVKEEES